MELKEYLDKMREKQRLTKQLNELSGELNCIEQEIFGFNIHLIMIGDVLTIEIECKDNTSLTLTETRAFGQQLIDIANHIEREGHKMPFPYDNGE